MRCGVQWQPLTMNKIAVVSAASPSPSRAYALLAIAALCWAGNMVAARLAIGHVSPMTLNCVRWVVCFMALFFVARRELLTHARALLPHWRLIAAMGAFGLAGFGALVYTAALYTSSINLSIIQGSIPVFVLIGAFLFQGKRANGWMMAGVALTLVGIVTIATQGELSRLLTLSFNIGDVFVLLGCVMYAGYALALPRRPDVPGIVFFAALALVGAVTGIPLWLAEISLGRSHMPDMQGWLVLAVVGLDPSFVAQLSFMRGVALIGPSRAGVFINLVPVFGAMLSVLILNEPFTLYHGAALACVLGGIFLAERHRAV